MESDMTERRLLVIDVSGAFTPENPPEDMGQEVWTLDFIDGVKPYFWFKEGLTRFSQYILKTGRVFPTRELAEASAKSYQTAVARGDKLVELQHELLADPYDEDAGEVSRKVGGKIQSILNDEVKG
jgi:hypothetical protein